MGTMTKRNLKVTEVENTVSKKEEVKVMEDVKVMTIEEMENFAAENNLVVVDTDNENVYELKTSKRAKKVKFVIEIKSEEKPKQVHTTKDRDIKIESGKVGDINVKLIYHRMKDGSKQYRIFLAKKIEGKLKRTRLVNDDIKAIQLDEKKMLEYYQKIMAGKVKVEVA